MSLLTVPEQEIVILYTNDIHSHLEKTAKIAATVRRLRKTYTDKVVLVDCGDHMDRMRLETEGSNGTANIEIMNATGYDIAVPGNNEGLTFSKSSLQRLYGREADFSLICSNMVDMQTEQHPGWCKPYEIVEKRGIRIGFIGATVSFPDFYNLLGWDIREPEEAVAHWVHRLRSEVDLLVVCSHLGLKADQRMADSIDGIDVILGAHTHHLLEKPLMSNGTRICAAGKFGDYLGELRLYFHPHTLSVVRSEGRCIPVADDDSAREIDDLIYRYREQSVAKLSKPLSYLDQGLDINWEAESELGNLLAAGLRTWTDAEIGLVNAGQILKSAAEGPISRKLLLEMCPSPINPCRMELTGEHLLQALEESLLSEYVCMPIKGFGFRGKQLGTLCIDGMTVLYYAEQDPYHKIDQVLIHGKPLERNRSYVLATIDMFTFGIGYMSLSKGEHIRYYLPEFIRDVMAEQLKQASAIEQCKIRRWKRMNSSNAT